MDLKLSAELTPPNPEPRASVVFSPSVSDSIRDWQKLAYQAPGQAELAEKALRDQILAQPLPQHTAEEWMALYVDAFKAYVALGEPLNQPEVDAALLRLDTIWFQAEAAGHRITLTMQTNGAPSPEVSQITTYFDPYKGDFPKEESK